ncbi:MAG: NUDIX domain-containing protein [Rhizobiaceae bacterium]
MTGSPEPRQSGWPRFRSKLFHLVFLFRRPMTLGVRILVHDTRANAVFLVRHTYVPGFQLPGGGVETGETVHQALERELMEEANIRLTREPALVSVHFNGHISKRDHVMLFVARDYSQDAAKSPDREIAEAGFFPIDALPADTTSGTRRRLAEIFGGAKVSSHW